jgi:hypothetical protein
MARRRLRNLPCVSYRNSIGPQESLKLNCNSPGNRQTGVYHWQILADADGEVNETNDQNNAMSGQISVTN